MINPIFFQLISGLKHEWFNDSIAFHFEGSWSRRSWCQPSNCLLLAMVAKNVLSFWLKKFFFNQIIIIIILNNISPQWEKKIQYFMLATKTRHPSILATNTGATKERSKVISRLDHQMVALLPRLCLPEHHALIITLVGIGDESPRMQMDLSSYLRIKMHSWCFLPSQMKTHALGWLST